MSLIARHLEQAGIPTLCLGSAHDILAAGRPPRALFLDYPLGHSAGRPFDRDNQLEVARAALEHLAGITAPGALVTLPWRWDPADPEDRWKAGAMDASAGDTRAPRDRTPRYQTEADRVLAEGA